MIEKDNTDNRQEKELYFSYLTGFITATIILVVVVFFLAYKIGFKHVASKLETSLFSRSADTVMVLPSDVLQELTELRAVIGNAGNPTNQPKHDTILVHPDPVLEYRLIPDSKIYVNMLRSILSFNFDPPNLNMDRPPEVLSRKLQDFIAQESRLSYIYSVDKEGFRVTLPAVESDKEILMIGDSVLFGSGVDDDATVASYYQKVLGDTIRVVNAGVGGYSGQQAFTFADLLSKDKSYEGLIYIACQNDFLKEDDVLAEANDVLRKLKSISSRFNNKVTVVFQTYMQYSMRDVFVHEGWSEEKINETELLRRELPAIATELGFNYFDWSDIVEEQMKKERSVFSRFALYVDHVHLSPLGNRLLAERLSKIH